MTTKQFNSKGQLIEELDCPPYPPLKKVEPNLKQTLVNLDSHLAPPFPKVDVDENEILAWCEYYLHSKKIERKLDHIYFPSTLSTFKKGGAK